MAIRESDIKQMPAEQRRILLLRWEAQISPGSREPGSAGWERELRVDYILLVWFLLPPVLLSPLLWQFWKKQLPTHN